MTKRKVTLRLSPDELAVVWPLENWRHLIMVYRTLAEEQAPEDAPYWNDAADYIEHCIQKSDTSQHDTEWE